MLVRLDRKRAGLASLTITSARSLCGQEKGDGVAVPFSFDLMFVVDIPRWPAGRRLRLLFLPTTSILPGYLGA